MAHEKGRHALRGKVQAGTVVEFWTVLYEAPRRYRTLRYLHCRCVCGKERDVFIGNLRAGSSSSCGCQTKKRTHGRSTTPESWIWRGMIQRCTNPNGKQWADYGGRGIRVCERWRHDFAAFLADVGERPSPGMTLDRIDNDGHYEPGNVRWATRKQQNNNTRWTHEARVQYGRRNAMRRWHPDSLVSNNSDQSVS